MPGFYTQTESGRTIHINGDPNMSEETRLALVAVMEAAVKQMNIEQQEFQRQWSLIPREGKSQSDAYFWFRAGVTFEYERAAKRIEYLEKRLRQEIEAQTPVRG